MLKFIPYPLAILPLSFLLGHIPFSSSIRAKQETQYTVKVPVHTAPGYNPGPVNGNDKYSLWNLAGKHLSKDAFEYAMKGYHYLLNKKLLHKENIVTIIDFSKPSDQKRLFIIDVEKGEVLFNTLVAHGHNSGIEYATNFSNNGRSHQSSLGFYITLGTYIGNNGYSLRLQGCEKGFNDHAYQRAVVLHGADYVSEDFIKDHGYLGRSYGCPAVPLSEHKKIIDLIRDGSCVFLYHPTKRYTNRSKIITG